MPPFEKIADQTGHLLLAEDGAIISSGGALENDETTAARLMQLIKTATADTQLTAGARLRKLSLVYEDHAYVICLSNRVYNIVKRSLDKGSPTHASKQ